MQDKMQLPIIVNLYGGPGSGKSTMAARVFSELKEEGINAELVTEYAKDMTWQESFKVLNNQLYVFAKQHHKIWRVTGKVDVIITDSPLLLSLIYGEIYSDTFKKLVMETVNLYTNIDVFLRRVKPYNSAGRSQDESQAKKLDTIIHRTLMEAGFTFDLEIDGKKESTYEICKKIQDTLNTSNEAIQYVKGRKETSTGLEKTQAEVRSNDA